jgi:hypothetical protein
MTLQLKLPSSIYDRKCVLFTFLILLFITNCSSQEEELPEHLKELENLSIYSPDTKAPYQIDFVQEQIFGDTQDVNFQFMYEVGVDDGGRVYISELAMGHRTIYVFDSEGNYLGNVGQEGDGPGEYQSPTHLQIKNKHLYIFDNLNQRISAYSLDSLLFSNAISLPFEEIRKEEELEGTRAQKLFVRKDGSFLVRFGSLTPNKDPRYEHYFLIGSNGNLQPKQIFKERAIPIFGHRSDDFSFTGMLPFSRKSMTVLSNNDNIISAWTGEMLIKEYDSVGNELHAFYYPFSNTEFDQEGFANDLSSTSNLRQVLPYVDVPETWPALEKMLIDDENRLWISTIVEDFDVYEWWVLKNPGELIAKFTWPRDSSIEIVKNGYMYTKKTDKETGLQQVVRYRFEMKEV